MCSDSRPSIVGRKSHKPTAGIDRLFNGAFTAADGADHPHHLHHHHHRRAFTGGSDENDCKFSSVIRFSASRDPGKNASARKTTTSTRIIDGKKVVTKKIEDNGTETVEIREDGVLKSLVINGNPQTVN
jgi:hypothetical protein